MIKLYSEKMVPGDRPGTIFESILRKDKS